MISPFETIKEYFLQPGFIFITSEPYIIRTILGSCVAVCLWDERIELGAMNHIVYPYSLRGERNARYGEVSVPYIIKLMLQMGSRTDFMVASIYGGAKSPEVDSPIGKMNIDITTKILNNYGIRIINKDIGGNNGRKIAFNVHTGEITSSIIQRIEKSEWYVGEEN